MAFGGGGHSGKVRSEINVTPLVDIVLVMLIIFLVAMPVVMKNIEIEVPSKVDEPPENVVLPDQVTLEVTKEGRILLNTVDTNRTELAQKLRDRLEHKREKVVFVDFDNNTRYGLAVELMDVAKGAGATTIAMKMKDLLQPVPGGAPAPAAPAPAPTSPNP